MKKNKARIASVCMAIAIFTAMLVSCADSDTTGKHPDTLKPLDTTVAEKVAAPASPEPEPPSMITRGTVKFVIGDDGEIAGSPSDYGIEFNIDGLKFTAAEYEDDMDDYVNILYDLLSDKTPYREERLSVTNGKPCAVFSSEPGWEQLPGAVIFSAAVPSRVISYHVSCGHLKDTSMVDFRMNGIALGDNFKKIIECYGEPTEKHTYPCYECWNGPDEEPDNGCRGHSYYYKFEDGSLLTVRILESGEVVGMDLKYADK